MTARIYKNGDRFYAMLHPVGKTRMSKKRGWEHYAVWRPIKSVCHIWIVNGKDFYLDTVGFEPTSQTYWGMPSEDC